MLHENLRFWRIVLSGFLLSLGLAQTLYADGHIILTITGATDSQIEGEKYTYTLNDLRDIGEDRVTTTTIWTNGEQHFTGVKLVNLLGNIDVTDATLRVTAINDYAITIPLSDSTSREALIAYENNGEVMSIRQKGPLWIIYPFDASNEFRTEVTYARSIWQLDRIEVLPNP